jgi:hypothetical protein
MLFENFNKVRCITHCGLWQHGLGQSAALFFLPIAVLLAAKNAL